MIALKEMQMLKLAGSVAMIAVMALGCSVAASASAAEWHTNGHKTFASTNAGAVRLLVHAAGGGAVVVACATSTVHGTLRGPTSSGSTFPGAGTVTPVFGVCTVSGAAGFTATCSPASLNAIGYAGGTTLATAGGGVTTASITSVDCTLRFGATPCSTITGSLHAHYSNPNPIGTGAGALTVTSAGQALTIAKVGAGCIAVPHGRLTVGAPGPGTTVMDSTYIVDGPNAPYLFRTP